ncbi:hypothetical protein A6A29_40340 [Streptomyces sp. TSRI0281]|nr:hypothetical protein A6A29_40340 [Streptomyces sp. TSRI0281]
MKLWDNKCDGHRVYAKYHFEILGDHKFGPATKCGHNYSRTFSEPEARFGEIKVCIADWGRDTCSKWAPWE